MVRDMFCFVSLGCGSYDRAQLFPTLVRGLIHVFLPLGTRLSVAETVRRWAPLLSHPAAPVMYHGAVSYVGWFWCDQLSPQLISLLENVYVMKL